MSADFVRTVETPIGPLTLRSNGEALCAVEFGGDGLRMEDAPVLLQAESELAEYFAGRRRAFSVPLCMQGTPFQMAVWRALTHISYGETASYGGIAEKIGRPKACRAVGMANHKNPLPVFVPCHRVVAADGKLTGYAGGLEIKKFLLELESINVKISGNG